MLQNQEAGLAGKKLIRKNANRRQLNVKEIIESAIQSFLPSSKVENADIDLITRLCVLASMPDGEENPREIVRLISSNLIEMFVSDLEKLQLNPVSAPVSQFFFIEWCFRHDHLNGDWKWKWDTINEGHILYSPKESVEKLLMRVKSPD